MVNTESMCPPASVGILSGQPTTSLADRCKTGGQYGGGWGPVAPPVFKTGGGLHSASRGGFDSHPLPCPYSVTVPHYVFAPIPFTSARNHSTRFSASTSWGNRLKRRLLKASSVAIR